MSNEELACNHRYKRLGVSIEKVAKTYDRNEYEIVKAIVFCCKCGEIKSEVVSRWKS